MPKRTPPPPQKAPAKKKATPKSAAKPAPKQTGKKGKNAGRESQRPRPLPQVGSILLPVSTSPLRRPKRAGACQPDERKKAQKKKGKNDDRSGVTETVRALESLIEHGRPEFMDAEPWRPHRPDRPEKSEGGFSFELKTDYEPAGDQPTAIKELVEGISDGEATQVLLGVTGSGKTYTMAQVISRLTKRPALVLAPNKTLAAQLYGEMKNFFPENAVEYFVSYYDYYQPEAYVPRSDTFIEKERLGERADRPHAPLPRREPCWNATTSIIVASVSCIYGIGSVETYSRDESSKMRCRRRRWTSARPAETN